MVISLLVTTVGILLWVFASGKPQEAGYVIFAVGLFYLVGLLAGTNWSGLLPKKGQ